MKTRVLILTLGLLAALFCSGCAGGQFSTDANKSETAVIQAALDFLVPQDFEGDMEGHHAGHYFGTSISFDFNFRGLKKVNGKWTWQSGGYNRTGVFSNGSIKLIPKQAP